MLIKALCDYYDCRNEKDLSEIPEGYGMQAVSWQVHLTEKGEISSINDCRDEVEIPQKTKNKDGTITEKPSKIKKSQGRSRCRSVRKKLQSVQILLNIVRCIFSD